MKNFSYIKFAFSFLSVALFIAACSENTPETSQTATTEVATESHEEIVKQG